MPPGECATKRRVGRRPRGPVARPIVNLRLPRMQHHPQRTGDRVLVLELFKKAIEPLDVRSSRASAEFQEGRCHALGWVLPGDAVRVERGDRLVPGTEIRAHRSVDLEVAPSTRLVTLFSSQKLDFAGVGVQHDVRKDVSATDEQLPTAVDLGAPVIVADAAELHLCPAEVELERVPVENDHLTPLVGCDSLVPAVDLVVQYRFKRPSPRLGQPLRSVALAPCRLAGGAWTLHHDDHCKSLHHSTRTAQGVHTSGPGPPCTAYQRSPTRTTAACAPLDRSVSVNTQACLTAVVLRGQVTGGKGEHAHWMTVHADLYEAKTGIALYPGTLNVQLDREWHVSGESIRLEPPEYGVPLSIVPCTIAGIPAFIVRTDKNDRGEGDHHPTVVELVSPVRLREALGLDDGDEVDIEVAY